VTVTPAHTAPRLLVLLGAAAAAFVLAVALGSVWVPPGQVIRALLGLKVENPVWTTIVWTVRLPRAVTALLVGAALGCTGLALQTLFANPLADPGVLGISSGAGLGAALTIFGSSIAGLQWVDRLQLAGTSAVVIASFLGALTVMSIVLAIARRVPHRATVLIVGVMIGYLTGAVVTVLAAFAPDAALRIYAVWGQGSFRGTDWAKVRVLAAVVGIAAVAFVSLAKPLDALLLGDRNAAALGTNLRRTRLLVIAITSALTGVITAFCGPIAFIGIAVPHVARTLTRSARHAPLFAACALVGACMALICEVASQLPGTERVLPINAMTALLGAPVVVSVLVRRRPLSDDR
jgi:iron complex transport system permease protein